MPVEPGTAQNIPTYAKIIIVIISLITIVLTSCWGKIMATTKRKHKEKHPESFAARLTKGVGSSLCSTTSWDGPMECRLKVSGSTRP
jgi:hypothetical protein